MIIGESVIKLVCLQVATGALAGNGLSYANAAAYIAAGWGLVAYDNTGVALAAQPTYTVAVLDSTIGLHRIIYTLPSGIGFILPTIPTGYRMDPRAWTFEGESYDADSIAGLLQTVQGVPLITSAADGDLGDVVDGDAWSGGTLTIPIGRLTPFGLTYADLAAGTITAGLKSSPTDTMTAITCAFVSAPAGTFKPSWATFPAAMKLTGSDQYKTWYMDVQFKSAGGLLITTNRYVLRVAWERDTVT